MKAKVWSYKQLSGSNYLTTEYFYQYDNINYHEAFYFFDVRTFMLVGSRTDLRVNISTLEYNFLPWHWNQLPLSVRTAVCWQKLSIDLCNGFNCIKSKVVVSIRTAVCWQKLYLRTYIYVMDSIVLLCLVNQFLSYLNKWYLYRIIQSVKRP